jgi:uncharacterized surface protein with fasciclin (FAS1) repeats
MMGLLHLTAAVAFVALAATVVTAADAPAGTKDVVDTAVAAGKFNTLVAAVKAAGLVDTLKGPGPFTVFAPTDEAFKKLPAGTVEALLKDPEKLKKILTYHVVAGKVMAKDAIRLDGKAARTVQGGELPVKVSDGKVMIGTAHVTKADVACSNGVIHIIDTVLIPE